MNLDKLSIDVQKAWNTAVTTRDAKDIEEFERLDDEYNILLINSKHNKLRNYRNNITNSDY
jgi:hypothetical protein